MRCLYACIVSLCLAAPAAVAAEKSPKLLGQWNCQGEEGAVALEFQSGNRFVYGGEPGNYALRPGAIVVEGEFGPEEYRYTLKGDRLDIIFPAGGRIQCARVAAGGKPPAAAGGGTAQLRGRLCKWSGSSSSYSGSSYSSLASAEFDGRGNVLYGSESSFSNSAGFGYGSGGGTRGTYRVAGDRVSIHFEDGSDVVATVNFRQADGSITELMVDGKVWGTALCQ